MVRSRTLHLLTSGSARQARREVLALLCVALLAGSGCGGDLEPMAFPGDPEYPAGPGLFTGESGEWVILPPTREEQLEIDAEQRDAE